MRTPNRPSLPIRGPALTLLAVLAIGVGLFAVNRTVTGDAALAAGAAGDGRGAATVGDGSGSATAQSPAPAVTHAAYAGRSAGNELTVAIGIENGKAVAYVSDRKGESWLEGSLRDGAVNLKGADGATVTGQVTGGSVLGTVSFGGASRPFAAQPERVAGGTTDRAALRALGRA